MTGHTWLQSNNVTDQNLVNLSPVSIAKVLTCYCNQRYYITRLLWFVIVICMFTITTLESSTVPGLAPSFGSIPAQMRPRWWNDRPGWCGSDGAVSNGLSCERLRERIEQHKSSYWRRRVGHQAGNSRCYSVLCFNSTPRFYIGRTRNAFLLRWSGKIVCYTRNALLRWSGKMYVVWEMFYYADHVRCLSNKK